MDALVRADVFALVTNATIPADESWIVHLTWDRLRSGDPVDDELIAELLIATWSLVPGWLAGAGLSPDVGPVRLFALIVALEFLAAELRAMRAHADDVDFDQFCWSMRVRLAAAAHDVEWLAHQTRRWAPKLGRFYCETIDIVTGLTGYLYFELIPRALWRRGMLPPPASETTTEELVLNAIREAPARIRRRQRRRGPLPRTSPWRILIEYELTELNLESPEAAERVRRLYCWAFRRVPAWLRKADFDSEFRRYWRYLHRWDDGPSPRQVQAAFRSISRFAKVSISPMITYLTQPCQGEDMLQLVRLILAEIMPSVFRQLMRDAEHDWLAISPFLLPRSSRDLVHHVIRRNRNFRDHHPDFYGVFFDQLMNWLDGYKTSQAA